ncbi:MAG: acyclic terpene utilization AtuA family protein [Dehalococcoidia bacterium]
MEPVKILVPVGSLGAGVRDVELEYGIRSGAQAIATDAGSTDSGAAYLAQGISKNSRGSVKRDLSKLMRAASEARIPLLIGTAGQAGGDKNVDWTVEIVREVALELGIAPKVAVLYSEIPIARMRALREEGRVKALPPLGPLSEETIDECAHIVALMGPEPYIDALQQGADIVVGGRTSDTAVISSFGLMHGAAAGPTWHAAKVAECGAQSTARRRGSGVLISVDDTGFEIEPLERDNLCTPESVSAHMLYENSDPFRLVEPGGILDVTEAVYTQLDERTVRVEGSKWEPRPYTMKLEGAGGGGFQTIMLIGIQDPDVLERVDYFHDRMLESLYRRARSTLPEDGGDFHISLRMYGWNAVSGDVPPEGTPAPRELGVLFVATAGTQELATQVAKACNAYFFHFPLDPEKELPSYSFAFTPADIERGQVYEFKLNHVVEVAEPSELVRTKWVDLGAAGK